MKIKINTRGVIQEGDNQGWEVCIEDDRLNTGGYLILITPSSKSDELVGYDNWVDSADALQKYFEEAHWKIQWCERDRNCDVQFGN